MLALCALIRLVSVDLTTTHYKQGKEKRRYNDYDNAIELPKKSCYFCKHNTRWFLLCIYMTAIQSKVE